MTDNEKHAIIDAIAFSRLVSKSFTTADCIVLHQWRNGFLKPKPKLLNKFKAVEKTIQQSKWERPELKYTEGGDLYQFCPKNLIWKKVATK